MVDRMMEQHKPVPAPFLTKTYQLVDDPSTDHIVSWGDDRLSTFVVWRPPEFARDVLPNYFKHNNFSSFVRQLNTYGFRKVVPERWEFANEYFRKGDKQLLCEIHRRKTPSSMPPSFSPSPPPFLPLYHPQPIHIPHPPPPPPPPTTTTRLLELTASVAGGDANAAASALMEENERLRRHNAALMSELANMRKLYNDIIYFVQNHVQPVAPSSLMNQRARMVMGLGLNANNNSSGSTTSSSSLTIVEEPLAVGNNNSSNGESSSRQLPKLFGVSLVSSSSGSKKRGLSLGDANDSSS